MIWTSIALSLLSLPLLWLVLPIFIMPPAALICGIVAWKRARQKAPDGLSLGRQLLYALPVLLAIAVGIFEFWILSTGYKA